MLRGLPPFPAQDLPTLMGAGCLDCRHLIDLVESTCEAFPRGIPLEILQDRIPHDRHYPGDRGIQFEQCRKLL